MKVTFKPGDVLLPSGIPRQCHSRHFLIVRSIISSLKEAIFSDLCAKEEFFIFREAYHIECQFLDCFSASKEKLVQR